MLNWLRKIIAPSISGTAPTILNDEKLGVPDTPSSATQFDGLSALANAQLERGETEAAISTLEQLVSKEPEHADARWRLGLVLYQTGRQAEATEQLRTALKLQPKMADAHFLLGSIAQEQGDLATAERHLREAVRLQPDLNAATCSLCIVLFQQGKAAEAKMVVEQGIAVNADVADLHFYLGNLHDSTGDFDSAIASFLQALSKQPDFIAAQFNLANLHAKTHRPEEALRAFQQVVEREPSFADAYNNMGLIHRQYGRSSDAISCFRRALIWNPQIAIAYSNLGTTLQEKQQFAQAIRSFDHAIATQPDLAEAYSNLSLAYKSCYEMPQAIAAAEQAFRLNPDFADARWAISVLKIMSLCEHEADVEVLNREAIAELDNLSTWCSERQIDGSMLQGMNPLFFLAGRETNARPILKRYGELCAQLMLAWFNRQQIAIIAPRNEGKIRLGIVSSNLHDHPVWNAILKGWYTHFDKNVLDIVSFDIGDHKDRHTEYAVANSVHYEDLQGRDLQYCVQRIVAQQPDVLLYASVGSVLTVKLASTRLAPLQIATWGHPETSGLPTIDYFASVRHFESDKAPQHYSEQLFLLPHVGGTCEPLAISDVSVDFAAMGIRADVPVLLCPGMPYKYAEENDHLLADIAHGIGPCQLIFFAATPIELSQKLEQRLTRSFAKRGLNFAHYARFIPWQSRDAFFALMKHANLFLDTIGYSGFTTAMQAAQCGLPIVTIEGQFMRGRFSSGILTEMGVTELIARSNQEYVDIAIKVATDRAYCDRLRQHLQERSHHLFNDVTPTAALEQFIVEKARQLQWSHPAQPSNN